MRSDNLFNFEAVFHGEGASWEVFHICMASGKYTWAAQLYEDLDFPLQGTLQLKCLICPSSTDLKGKRSNGVHTINVPSNVALLPVPFPCILLLPMGAPGIHTRTEITGRRREQQAVLQGNETENSEGKGNVFAVYSQNMKTT